MVFQTSEWFGIWSNAVRTLMPNKTKSVGRCDLYRACTLSDIYICNVLNEPQKRVFRGQDRCSFHNTGSGRSCVSGCKIQLFPEEIRYRQLRRSQWANNNIDKCNKYQQITKIQYTYEYLDKTLTNNQLSINTHSQSSHSDRELIWFWSLISDCRVFLVDCILTIVLSCS